MNTVLAIVALIGVTIFLLYLFVIMPRIRNAADMDLLRVDYAHRGLHDTCIPENSLAAFRLARDAGYGIELDIRLSRDKKIMVFHDDTLKRMCGIDRRVEEMTCAELQQLRLGKSNQTIPTLAQVLELVEGKAPLLIEVKGIGKETALCIRASRMLDSYAGAFAIESFNPLILSWFKNYRPRFARGILVTKVLPTDKKIRQRLICFGLRHMLFNIIARPDFIAINGKLRSRPAFFLTTRLFRAPGFIWTVRTPESYRECRKKEYYTIFEKFHP